MNKPAVILGALLLAAGGVAWAYGRSKNDEQSTAEGWLTMFDQNDTPATRPGLQSQLAAMLQAIAHAEGTANQADPYRVCYAYRHVIRDLSDHPAVTGEWRGEKLPDAQCRAAGYGPGCVSTAAGKYQITRTTWARLKTKLNLRDFAASSQDAAGAELLRECGAADYLQAGDFASAVRAARRTWASLPGAGYDQPERSLAWVQARFEQAGGVA